MADRYWVGGTGTWDTTSTTNWSASSGGASGASVPTAADSVFFDQAGTYTVTMTGALLCLDITVSAGTVTFSDGTSPTLAINGSMSLLAGTLWSATGLITFNATTTGKTVTTNGVTVSGSVTFDGVGGEWALQSALTLGSTRTSTLTNGTLSLQTYTLTTGLFNSSNLNTRTIAFDTGSITVNGTGTGIYTTNLSSGLTATGTRVVNVSNNSAISASISVGNLSEANVVSFNFTVGTYTLSYSSGNYGSLNFTGFSGTTTNSFGSVIFGNLTLSTGMTFGGGSNLQFRSTSVTPRTITTSGKTIIYTNTFFNGVGGTWVLQDAMTLGSGSTLTQSDGTLDLNGKTLTVGNRYTTSTGTKNLTFNGGTLVCPGVTTTAFNNAAPTNYTTTAGTGTGTISMTGATAKTFVGGGSTFNCTLNQGGAGALTITGANTFTNITNSVQPASVLFTSGTTTTFTNFSLSGTAGNLITIGSDIGASHTLSKASGTVSADYLSISQSNATGGAAWYAGANSTDGGSNSGWIFAASPAVSAFFSVL